MSFYKISGKILIMSRRFFLPLFQKVCLSADNQQNMLIW